CGALRRGRRDIMSDTPFIDFNGQWVVLTGASSGLGRAIAIELASQNARIVLVGRNEARLRETEARLPVGSAHVLVQDLRQTESILPKVRDHVQSHGRIYGLSYCSGVVETRPLTAFQVSTFRQMVEINVTAALELSRVIARRDVMTEGAGVLLFIASIYGTVGMAGQTAYSATKGALMAAARAMAIEL